MPIVPSHTTSKNTEKDIKQYYIIDTKYWIDMFDGKKDISDTIYRYINNSNEHSSQNPNTSTCNR